MTIEQWALVFSIFAFVFSGSCYLICCMIFNKANEINDTVKRIREDQNWDRFHGDQEGDT